MATSLALIRWDAEPNKAVAIIDKNSRPDGGRWALVLHALLHPSPGRTLDRMYTSLGGVLEKRANKVAYALGLGPHVVAQKIKSYFGNGEQRVQQLELLRTSVPPRLEKQCIKLIGYTLPTESASMQRQAFKEIVNLVTLFPGLRLVFLHTRLLDSAKSLDAISALWERHTGSPNEEWAFWKTLGAMGLSHSNISAMIEASPILKLSKCSVDGLSIIERLLVECDCSSDGASNFPNALCFRYLGGIFDLPGFWLDLSSINTTIAHKMCREMVRVMKDLGVDILVLGVINEGEPEFDYEGIDFLATRILNGLSSWITKLEPEDWPAQPWYESFIGFIELLRRG
ncbi:High osmolarity signaling protein SHO1 [Mycena venus]|uniref:High osmolarity signaling protein SHO1 n=1 Tax=Mycena venus TaxID=2733690 RepID=A0A8H6WTR1_9AGAR|nr:High osmolarity signaling protein SHO1 [Mycena venus]